MVTEIQGHKFTNYDITKTNLLKLFPIADAVYVDPPWSQGNYRYWRTMNNDRHNHSDYLKFIRTLLQTSISITDDRNILLIEVGKSFAGNFEDILNEYDELSNFRRYKSYYQKKYWNYYYTINFNLDKYNLPDRMTGNKLTDYVFQEFERMEIGCVLDPCLGLGTTLKFCIKYSMSCYGNEVNEDRLKKAIRRNIE